MEQRISATGETSHPGSQPSPFTHGHMRKRQRSNPGPDIAPYDDVFVGGNWRYSPVSDPDIDYNAQSSKRYLSEVMASNLTRHMSLRPSTSAGPGTGGQPPGSPGDDLATHVYPPPALTPMPPALSHPHPHSQLHVHPFGAGPQTPPGGCSPQRTCVSEMSDGLTDAGGDFLQPMLTSDASFSVSVSVSASQGAGGGGGGVGGGTGPGGGAGAGKAYAAAADSNSETADSELLDERERSVSLSGLLWTGASTGAPTAAAGTGAAGGGVGPVTAGLGGAVAGASGAWAGVRGPPSSAPAMGASTPCAGISAVPYGGCYGSPFSQGAFPRRLSEASAQCASAAAGPLSAFQSPQQQQQQQLLMQQQLQQQQQHVLRGPPYTRGNSSGGRGGLLADIPSSPSDSRFGGLDLRKTALLRSLSRRAEESTSEGGGGASAAAAVAAAAAAGTCPPAGASGAACSGGGGGVMSEHLIPEAMASTGGPCHSRMTMTGVAAAAAMGLPLERRGRRGTGIGGSAARSALSGSDSGFSDGMSEGGGGSGGGGGATGMELSSTTADGGGGGGGGTTTGTPLSEGLESSPPPTQQQQQQPEGHQQRLQQQEQV